MQVIVEKPETYTRETEQTTGIAKLNAYLILKDQQWYSFNFRICKHIREGDVKRHRTFSEWYTCTVKVMETFPIKYK